MDTRAVLEEIIYSQLGHIVTTLHAAIEPEIDRLNKEKEVLAKQLEESHAVQPDIATSLSSSSADTNRRSRSISCSRPSSRATSGFRSAGHGIGKSARRTLDLEDAETRREATQVVDMDVQSLSLQAEDHFENLYDLTQAFRQICRGSQRSMSVNDLVDMSAQQGDVDPFGTEMVELRARMSCALHRLNDELGLPPIGPDGDVRVYFGTFLAIMQQHHEFYEDLDEDVLLSTLEVRDILVKETTMRVVARATHMSCKDMCGANSVPPNRMHRILHYLDPIIGLVIILNAIVISISTDVAYESDFWLWTEVSFTVVFLVELCIKMLANGPSAYFCGQDMFWNIFDILVVLVATVDVVFALLGSLVNLGNFTIIRLLRFARLTKLVRVLRLKLFKELALMVNGLLAGLRVLVWAIVFLGFLLFSLGVLLTRTIGHQDVGYWARLCNGVEGPPLRACSNSAKHLEESYKELFGDVFHSTFTVFRCFTDGCNSLDGTPLVPHFYNTYGMAPVVMYMMVTLFVMFGLFNLIMAIFVEDTIDSAKRIRDRRREERYQEDIRLANRLQRLVVMFCTDKASLDRSPSSKKRSTWATALHWIQSVFGTRQSPQLSQEEEAMALGGQYPTNLTVAVRKDAFEAVLQRREAQVMLDELEIDPQSRSSLFDILDSNSNGILEVNELVSGLLKLRGSDSKGDHVAALLAIRSMQKSLKSMKALTLHQQKEVRLIADMQKRVFRVFEEDAAREKEQTWHKKVRFAAGLGLRAMEDVLATDASYKSL